ncbi:MAG: rRNA pseudouridine synthase [Armatimonadota bacterium]|nr:MAG: rRNA pseudouridine synthase [Armatimonadota bacterium]
MRLQKYLSAAGVASRRSAEELIAAGRVTVDGKVATLGDKADPSRQTVAVDGQPVASVAHAYFMLNKPKGYLTTVSDRFGRRAVMDLIPDAPPGTHPVGRLDADTEGLLLLTNHGDLTAALTRPSQEIEKVYLARVRGVPSHGDLERLRSGVKLEDGLTAPAKARLIDRQNDEAIVELTIYEGRKRQVKRMMAKVRHPVVVLKRTGFGPLRLGGLPRGESRELSDSEVRACIAAATRQPSPRRR